MANKKMKKAQKAAKQQQQTIAGSDAGVGDIVVRPHRSLKTTTIKRSFPFSYATSTTVGSNPTEYGVSLSMNNLPNAAELAAVWDQYKIDEVSVTFFSPYNTFGQGVSTTYSGSIQSRPSLLLHWVHDYDDANTLTLNGMSEYDTYRVFNLGKGEDVTIRYKPQIAIAADSGGFFTAYAPKSDQWIDFSYPGVNHFGLKFDLEQVYADGDSTLVATNPVGCFVKVVYTYTISLRALK